MEAQITILETKQKIRSVENEVKFCNQALTLTEFDNNIVYWKDYPWKILKVKFFLTDKHGADVENVEKLVK